VLRRLHKSSSQQALRGKLIASLSEKPAALSVQAAALGNTPLITQSVTSPIVARGLLADPAHRDELLSLPHTKARRQGGAGTGGVRNLSSQRKQRFGPSSAGADLDGGRGVELRALLTTPGGSGAGAGNSGGRAWRSGVGAAGSGAPTPRADSKTVSSSTPAAAARQSMVGVVSGSAAAGLGTSSTKGLQGIAAALPEALGLPMDEQSAYLILLRRHVLYGPTLGLAVPAAAAGVGSAGLGGATSAAAAASLY